MNFLFPFSWECHHPNWRTPSFFRWVDIPPASYVWWHRRFFPGYTPTRKPWDNCHVSNGRLSAKEPGLTKLVEAVFADHPLAICMAYNYDYETHSNPQRLNMYSIYIYIYRDNICICIYVYIYACNRCNTYIKRMLYMFNYPTSFSIISFQGALL